MVARSRAASGGRSAPTRRRDARAAPRVARLLPSPETLNLFVGAVSATAINLVTTGALGQAPRPGRLLLSGSFMLAGALVLGGLAIWLTHARDDALANLPASISLLERRALLRDAVNARSRAVLASVGGSVVLLVASVLVLVL